jgi:hypothetical protein
LPVARRRRAVERASRRQTITDRVVAVVLAVVAASGLMSVLPGRSQAAVSRFTCRLATLGLSACGRSGLDLENTRLNLPRCPALATLDEALPEVRVTQLQLEDGLFVTIGAARTGDVSVTFGPTAQPAPPSLLNGQRRTTQQVSDGVVLPTSVEWLLPSGQGLDPLVEAVSDRHRQWVERRSALAVLSPALARGDLEIPPPTVLLGQVRLDEPLLPTFPDSPEIPRSGVAPPPSRVPRATVNRVSVVPSSPAGTVYNRVSRQFSVVAPVVGTFGRVDVAGTVRWTRDADGNITSVLVGIVSPAALTPGEKLPRDTASTGVAYISVPVVTEPERALAQQWLSDPAGFQVSLDEVLGLASADPANRLASFLTRAATVTLVRYSGIDAADAQLRVRSELMSLRRVDWASARMLSAATIAPQPGGAVRTAVNDPLCRRP